MIETRPAQSVSEWLSGFGAALERADIPGVVAMFDDDCYWRDLVSFTWNIKTLEGKEQIATMLEATRASVAPSKWALEGEPAEANGIVEGWFTFETAVARGRGHIRLKGERCWTLLTTMTELKGYEERTGGRRDKGVQHGVVEDRMSWLERKKKDEAELGHTKEPYCVIVGGGQGGIALGARLRRLGVPTIILEKNERPGDSWRKRYKSLCLHDPVWYDHLPYLPFPDHWPVFSPKDKIGDWLEMYTKVMELNFWSSTECKRASYDEAREEWTVVAERDGKEIVLHPKQLVLATGMSAVPNVPNFPGAETFKGVQHHSSKHRGGDEFASMKCIVVGSNNSAHDICADLWEHGAEVTMVQRTPTHISRSDTLMNLALGGLYSETAVKSGITTDMADLIFASVPYKIMAGFHVPVYEEMARVDAAFYERLERAGFLLDWGEDKSGLFMKYLRRGSGYYIDVGASELVADGKIKLKSGVTIERIKEH
ncbi:MAG: NAD(P)-binding domain-containing protein, partial [Vulcanimicrobiaceae bacterium]